MLTSSKPLLVLVVALVAGMLVSSTVAAFYLFQYNQAESNASTYLSELNQATGTRGFVATTNILLDFGNGTQRWYNNTQVQPGWNVYLVTVVVTNGNLNDTWYPQYGEHLVNGIDGVQNGQRLSWFLWSYNETSHWQVAQTGADELLASNGSVYAWSYCGLTATYAPACASP
jgi:hypothetical protein